MSEPIFHLALASDWEAAVRERFYADVVEPLVLLVIEPERLEAEVRVEAVPDSDETFPHVYGPINVGAVVEVRSLGQ